MVGRRVALRVAIVGTLLLTVPGAGLVGGARASAIDGRPLAVVSLGDSYISGLAGRWLGNSPDNSRDRRGTDRAYVGPPAGPKYDTGPIYGDTAGQCFRSDVAEITHVRFPGITPVNLACAGATTGSVIRNGSGTSQNDRLAEVARTHRVLAIVVSIGGNDIGFATVVQNCIVAFLANSGPCNPGQQSIVDGLLPAMRAAVGRTIDDIRATMTEAGYRNRSYRLIVQSYPAPLPFAANMRYPESDVDNTRFLVAGCPFYDVDVDWGHASLPGRLADTLRAVSAERHVQFMDVRDAFRGHELCSAAARQPETAPEASSSEWMRWIDVPFFQGALTESLHPNAYGQQALGRCLRLTLLVFGDVSCHGIPGQPPSSVYVRRLH